MGFKNLKTARLVLQGDNTTGHKDDSSDTEGERVAANVRGTPKIVRKSKNAPPPAAASSLAPLEDSAEREDGQEGAMEMDSEE
jgi:hypothetical protein